MLIAAVNGATNVADCLEREQQMRSEAALDRRLAVTTLRCRARLEAMRCDFELARELIAEALALTDELGLRAVATSVQFELGAIELLAGRPAAAEQALAPSVEGLLGMGDLGHLSSVAPFYADALFAQGRGEEAATVIERTAEWPIADDLDPQIGWRRTMARLLAGRGEFADAERLARESVALAATTDFLEAHARAFEDLAEVLRLAGRPQEAPAELERAIRLHEQKGNRAAEAIARGRLEALGRASPEPA